MKKSGNWMRRMAGLLRARLPELRFDRVVDTRGARGKRWRLDVALSATLVSVLAGLKSFKAAESFTDEMSKSLRRLLGITRRMADTTLRDIACGLTPEAMRECLHRQVKAAHRRKALEPTFTPFGVVALDGKSVTSKSWDTQWAMEHSSGEGTPTVGLVRTVTACLTSSAAKLCLDAIPIPASTNEVGHLRAVVDELHRIYGHTRMFRMLTYDAGGCSEENAEYITALGYEYLFAIKDSQPQLLAAMKRALEDAPRTARTEDVLSDKSVVTRRLHLVTPRLEPVRWGKHAKTFLCIVSSHVDKDGNRFIGKDGKPLEDEVRYFVCSLHGEKLTADAWLALVRSHWAVENACHYTYDVAFEEDAHPWVTKAPTTMLCLAILRRIAANMLALLRATSRSEEGRQIPWADVIRRLYNFAIAAPAADLENFRVRKAFAALT